MTAFKNNVLFSKKKQEDIFGNKSVENYERNYFFLQILAF